MSSRGKDDQINELKSAYVEAQKKTFTKWANSFIKDRGAVINDLFVDLQDGRNLLMLLEKLSGEVLVSLLLPLYVIGRFSSLSKID